jgi:threonyl-tRNA synthetase
MKILQLHCDFIEYELIKKEIRLAEKCEKKRQRLNNLVVLFTTIEKDDNKEIVKKAIADVKKSIKRLKVNRILIYPYSHLSNNLASPSIALDLLREMEKEAKTKKLRVNRVPFGWNKSFTIKIKGHPLAEQFKVISGKQIKRETIEEVAKKVKSRFIILTPDGKEYKLNLKKIDKCKILKKYSLLKSFIISEEIKGQPSKSPPSIEIMRKLELIDYEPASEPGMFRYYPNGALIKDLLEKWISKIVVDDLNAMKIDTPILYNFDEPDIKEQAMAFMERDYRIELPNKTLILRFAGDFGLFKMMKDCTFTYKQLPLRIFEISPSFRKEKRGELTGLRRCSFFYMPDLHCFCMDLEQGKKEYETLFKKYTKFLNGIKIDYAIAFRIVEKYYKELKPMLIRVLKHAKKPALIELLRGAKHYWVCKSEHQAIDSVGGNAQLCTVQLDVEDSERYGIKYVDKNGKKKGCIIVHSSVGSIERLIYAILETAAKAKKNPVLPLWLSPTQIRIIPLSQKYFKFAKKIMKKIEAKNIRVDLDDRDETVPKKIRDAEINWVPIVLVIGPEEIKTNKFNVRFRKSGKIKRMKLEKLLDKIKKEIKEMPFEKISIPKLISKRPIFVAWGK